jgi:hypothetical protein
LEHLSLQNKKEAVATYKATASFLFSEPDIMDEIV